MEENMEERIKTITFYKSKYLICLTDYSQDNLTFPVTELEDDDLELLYELYERLNKYKK
jgi:hypothetical protein